MRYLIGELSETERTEIEASYFADKSILNRLVQVEEDLIDNYARGRLSPQVRERFERAYLSQPGRHARAKFGVALAGRLDQLADSRSPAEQDQRAGSWLGKYFSLFGGGRPGLAFSLALLLLLLVAGSVWLFLQRRQLQQDIARNQAAQSMQEQRQQELQKQLDDEQKRHQDLTTKLAQQSNANTPVNRPSPPATPTFVSLLLVAGGVRGVDTGLTPTLTIPKGTEQVHLQLNLKDNDYRDYQLSVQLVGGAEIFQSHAPKPKTSKTGATFSLIVPASKFVTGDYMLTVKGATPGGEFEDVSKSLFRVEKK